MTPPETTSPEFPVLKFSQPAGDFFLACMPATVVARISYAEPRTYDPSRKAPSEGLNRQVSRQRVGAIADYCQSADAAFPTAVILAVRSSDCELSHDEGTIHLHGTAPFANIVDGQHRIQGLRSSGATESFAMPVVLLIDATPEQQALLFATINGTQTRVPPSLIYDLFEVTESRSPQKTAHEVARALNESPESPWYRRLKMLGRKSSPDSLETVTQGTFVRELLRHMTANQQHDFDAARKGKPFADDPARVLRRYFVANEDGVILKIMLNLFSAQRDVWPEQWDSDSSILRKSTGFMATMWALASLISAGQSAKDLSQSWFRHVFAQAKRSLEGEHKELTGASFSSSGPGIRELSRYFSIAATGQEPIVFDQDSTR